MKSFKALETNPEEVPTATKKAAQKLTNFRVSCESPVELSVPKKRKVESDQILLWCFHLNIFIKK